MGNDFAVIVGLQSYPGFDDPENGKKPLSGPENDAKNFYDWVASPEGGDVPPQNIRMVLSSDYPPPANGDFSDAQPAEREISAAFDKLRHLSLENQRQQLGSQIGRRLYIFMSGHGIAPTPYGNKTERESALLMCNADPTNITAPKYHIPGSYTVLWFCTNDCFEEVFLFMDCCRDMVVVPNVNAYLPPIGNADTARRFTAFSTKWSRQSKEKAFSGKTEGIFTKTLMLGLRGACAEPDPNNPGQGIITGASLKSFLYRNIKEFVDPLFVNEAQEPDIDYYPKANEGRDIVISRTQLQTFPLLISIPFNGTGDVVILDDKLDEIKKVPVVNPPLVLPFALSRGTYLAICTVNGAVSRVRFEIKGVESAGSEARVSF